MVWLTRTPLVTGEPCLLTYWGRRRENDHLDYNEYKGQACWGSARERQARPSFMGSSGPVEGPETGGVLAAQRGRWWWRMGAKGSMAA